MLLQVANQLEAQHAMLQAVSCTLATDAGAEGFKPEELIVGSLEWRCCAMHLQAVRGCSQGASAAWKASHHPVACSTLLPLTVQPFDVLCAFVRCHHLLSCMACLSLVLVNTLTGQSITDCLMKQTDRPAVCAMLCLLAHLVLLLCSSLCPRIAFYGVQNGNAELDLTNVPWSASLPIYVPSDIVTHQCRSCNCTTFQLL